MPPTVQPPRLLLNRAGTVIPTWLNAREAGPVVEAAAALQ